ncbi:MAG: hypothetical protein ACLUOF_12135 [Ruminococcus sp.]
MVQHRQGEDVVSLNVYLNRDPEETTTTTTTVTGTVTTTTETAAGSAESTTQTSTAAFRNHFATGGTAQTSTTTCDSRHNGNADG